MDRWNGRGSPGANPRTTGQLIFDKDTGNARWGKGRLFDKRHWENWTFARKRMKRDPYASRAQVNSKWTRDLRVRPATVKLLEDNSRGKPLTLDLEGISCL